MSLQPHNGSVEARILHLTTEASDANDRKHWTDLTQTYRLVYSRRPKIMIAEYPQISCILDVSRIKSFGITFDVSGSLARGSQVTSLFDSKDPQGVYSGYPSDFWDQNSFELRDNIFKIW